MVLLFAFGPYLTNSGIRLIHIVYIFLPLLLINIKELESYKIISSLLTLFIILVLWFIFVTILFDFENITVIIANLDNFLLPIALIVFFVTNSKRLSIESIELLIVNLAKVFLIILAINSVLIFLHLYVDISWVFEPFLRTGGRLGNENVWIRSARMERFIGIFSTPFESGIVNSLGLLVWGYLYKSQKELSKKYWVFLGIIVLGGLIALSKAFFLGIIILLIFITSKKIIKNIININIIFILFFIITIGSYVFDIWLGFDSLKKYLIFDDYNAFYEIYLGGRYNPGATAMTSIKKITSDVLITGYGLSYDGIVDSAYLQILAFGGIIGLLIFLLILLKLFYYGFSSRNFSNEGRFIYFSVIFIFIASFGAPVLTKNKFSEIYLLFIYLMIYKNLLINKNNKYWNKVLSSV